MRSKHTARPKAAASAGPGPPAAVARRTSSWAASSATSKAPVSLAEMVTVRSSSRWSAARDWVCSGVCGNVRGGVCGRVWVCVYAASKAWASRACTSICACKPRRCRCSASQVLARV